MSDKWGVSASTRRVLKLGAATGIAVIVLGALLMWSGSGSAPSGPVPQSAPARGLGTAPSSASGPFSPRPDGGLNLRRPPEGPSMIWRLVASVLVVGLLGAVAILVARKRVGPGLLGPRNRSLSVIESTRLAPRTGVYLLQAGNRKYLLGAGREQVTFLAEVTEAFDDHAPSC